ncbi:unnamed protein product [Boreogadus saida]
MLWNVCFPQAGNILSHAAQPSSSSTVWGSATVRRALTSLLEEEWVPGVFTTLRTTVNRGELRDDTPAGLMEAVSPAHRVLPYPHISAPIRTMLGFEVNLIPHELDESGLAVGLHSASVTTSVELTAFQLAG